MSMRLRKINNSKWKKHEIWKGRKQWENRKKTPTKFLISVLTNKHIKMKQEEWITNGKNTNEIYKTKRKIKMRKEERTKKKETKA